MIRPAIVEAVLPTLPGWESATVRELPGGHTNNSWLLQQDGRCAVLKVDEGPRGVPFVSRLEEARMQSAAAAASLANRTWIAKYRSETTTATTPTASIIAEMTSQSMRFLLFHKF